MRMLQSQHLFSDAQDALKVGWKIWLRALLYTGAGWGVVLAALYGYFRGLPF